MSKAIRPSQVVKKKQTIFPNFVIDSFNDLIVEKFSNNSATFLQKDVITKMLCKKEGLSRDNIFEKHYMDIEDIFEEAGWIVDYDKPGYCEDYEAYFTFTKKR